MSTLTVDATLSGVFSGMAPYERLATMTADNAACLVDTFAPAPEFAALVHLTDGDVPHAAQLCLDAREVITDPDNAVAASQRLRAAGVSSYAQFPSVVTDGIERIRARIDALPDSLYTSWLMTGLEPPASRKRGAEDLDEPGPSAKRSRPLGSRPVTGHKRAREGEPEAPPAKRLRPLGPHGGKNLHSAFFLDPDSATVPTDVDFDDHDAFTAARHNWIGATNVYGCAKLNPFSEPERKFGEITGTVAKEPYSARTLANFAMGHETEPKVIAESLRHLPGLAFAGKAFHHIPGTCVVVAPDEVIADPPAAHAELFAPPYAPVQTFEVKSHHARINHPASNPSLLVQGFLQCLAANGWADVPPGVVPAFVAAEYNCEAAELRVWHVAFHAPGFGKAVIDFVRRLHAAILDPDGEVPQFHWADTGLVCTQLI